MEKAQTIQPTIQSYGLTHQGKVRDHNEDSFLQLDLEGLWVVADGAGGHEKGEVASQLIVSELGKFTRQGNLKADVGLLANTLQQVNGELVDMRESLPSRSLIGSTVCALLIDGGHCVCLWSGDSRIYLYRQDTLFLLTQDHNRIDEFIHAGFAEAELVSYPAAHQLTKAVGATDLLSLDVLVYECVEGDLYLLCSDGLTGELESGDITKILQTASLPEEIGKMLLDAVLEKRAKDNVTSILVRLEKF